MLASHCAQAGRPQSCRRRVERQLRQTWRTPMTTNKPRTDERARHTSQRASRAESAELLSTTPCSADRHALLCVRQHDSFRCAACQALYCMSRSAAARPRDPPGPRLPPRGRRRNRSGPGRPLEPRRRPARRPRRRHGRDEHDQLLSALGERARSLRARRGLTRKAVAQSLAACRSATWPAWSRAPAMRVDPDPATRWHSALQCSLAELVGDVTTTSPEWLLIRELLRAAAKPTCAGAPRIALRLLGTRRRPAPGTQPPHRAGRACAARANRRSARCWPTTWTCPSSS